MEARLLAELRIIRRRDLIGTPHPAAVASSTSRFPAAWAAPQDSASFKGTKRTYPIPALQYAGI
ncbi:hypothetical protein [Rhizobium sullae]|uniref:hypothetical protein n=1 Tax=Rhizobium sullae TaxID=50338 RepID=UPI0010460728|nr:hypothetical protein [Rhizobium sullae]